MLRIGRTYPHYYSGLTGGTEVARFHYTIPNGTLHADPADLPRAGRIINIGISAGAAVFGAIHLAAWNFDFPTLVEKQVWRVAALIVTAVFPLVILINSLGHYAVAPTSNRGIIFIVWVHAVSILAVAFVLARLYLLVEAFRSLYYLPPAVYLATAAAEAPHVG